MKQPLQIAIDGPVAAGKGDIAEHLAAKLGLIYLYTGAMYRVLALACIRQNISTKDPQKVIDLLKELNIDFVPGDQEKNRSYKLLLNGEDVTDAIFVQQVALGSSDVSVIPEVRKQMVQNQRKIAEGKNIVAEGRDIGLRVLPNAQMKIFLTASLTERARRRYEQFKNRGIINTLEQVIEDTKIRDLQDSTREADPLQKLPDHWELDTTTLTQEEVIEKIIMELKKRKLI